MFDIINEMLKNDKVKNEIILKKKDIKILLSFIKHQEDLLNQTLKDYDEENEKVYELNKLIDNMYNQLINNIYNRNDLLMTLNECKMIVNDSKEVISK